MSRVLVERIELVKANIQKLERLEGLLEILQQALFLRFKVAHETS